MGDFPFQVVAKIHICTKFELNRLKTATPMVLTHKSIYKYIYKVLNEHSNHVLGVRIGANFSLPGLRVVVSAVAIAHFSYGN